MVIKVTTKRVSDGKTTTFDWYPEKETIRDAMTRAGIPRLAQIEVPKVCGDCGSNKVYDDGTCAVCVGQWKS
jgi:ferredoxin